MPPKLARMVKIDKQGRMVIPRSIREELGLTGERRVLLIGDVDNKVIRILPYAFPGVEAVEVRFRLDNNPGVLSKILALLAEYRINITYDVGHPVGDGLQAEWYGVVDISNCRHSISKVKQMLDGMPGVRVLKFEKFR